MNKLYTAHHCADTYLYCTGECEDCGLRNSRLSSDGKYGTEVDGPIGTCAKYDMLCNHANSAGGCTIQYCDRTSKDFPNGKLISALNLRKPISVTEPYREWFKKSFDMCIKILNASVEPGERVIFYVYVSNPPTGVFRGEDQLSKFCSYIQSNIIDAIKKYDIDIELISIRKKEPDAVITDEIMIFKNNTMR